jgi:hypothetical protein
MKLKVVVVDMEIPPRIKRWALRVSVTVGVLAAGTVALAATPLHVWNTGDTLQAADINGNFSNLQGQIQGIALSCTVVEGAWTTSNTYADATPVTCPAGYVVTSCGCTGSGSNSMAGAVNGQAAGSPGSLGAAANCVCAVTAGGSQVAPIAVCCKVSTP